MWALRTYAPHFITELMGVPRDTALSPADHARLEEELDAIFPVSRRVHGVLFDAFTGNKAVNATAPGGGHRPDACHPLPR